MQNVRPYTLKRGFLSRPRNHDVRCITRGNTPAQERAIIWAFQALSGSLTKDDYKYPIVRKGDTAGQFSFYHYCQDTITGVRYDRKAGVWLASVQRVVELPRHDASGFFNPHRSIINFELAIIAA